MMYEETKRKWVDALRSGKFQQGRSALRRVFSEIADHAEYCCLGVLYETVHGKEAWNVMDYGMCKTSHGDRSATMYVGCGLTRMDADFLARMNDAGKTFTEIADYIERVL